MPALRGDRQAVSLTGAEKLAGRAFRDDQRARLAAMPEAAACSGFIREYRHACPKYRGASAAIRLREHSRLSELLVVYPDTGEVIRKIGFALQAGPPYVTVPAGTFAFLWLDGHCSCGFTVRSAGRVVLAAGLLEERSG